MKHASALRPIFAFAIVASSFVVIACSTPDSHPPIIGDCTGANCIAGGSAAGSGGGGTGTTGDGSTTTTGDGSTSTGDGGTGIGDSGGTVGSE